MATEKTIFKDGNVIVSPTRFVVESTTYPINGITSVCPVTVHPFSTAGMFLIAIGLLGLLGCGAFWQLGILRVLAVAFVSIVLMALGVWLSRVTKYAVEIITAAGQQPAVISSDRNAIHRIVKRIEQAIVQRG